VVLMPLLANMFPFYLSDVYVLQCYVDNLLQLTTYLPKSRRHVLRIVFVELTKIDVSFCFLFAELMRRYIFINRISVCTNSFGRELMHI